MQKKIPYSFDTLLTAKQWEELNSDLCDFIRYDTNDRRMIDIFKEQVENDLDFLQSEMIEGATFQHNGITCLATEEYAYTRASRKEQRMYNVLSQIQQECIYDSYGESDGYNLDTTEYNLLAMWERRESKYHQRMLAHYVYLAQFLEEIADRRNKKPLE